MEWKIFGMVWKVSGMEWNRMEDFACYGRWKIYIPLYALTGTTIEYNEPGRVGIPAVRVVAV